MQLDLAGIILDGDHGVFQIDQVFLLQFEQLGAHFFGLELILVAYDYQVAHENVLLHSGSTRSAEPHVPALNCSAIELHFISAG
jgi:hypothetical protein